ncbi:hypothetical protein BM221_000702 [Beauveria bassiana]|uniref:Uncharacterized protein n=1 Tax=Beauveria bassiana TaxID=176275 RepID=A0A2N6P192_BEABA|nr:hypothetical protein BM221_000702 [Beauveria bassiana]
MDLFSGRRKNSMISGNENANLSKSLEPKLVDDVFSRGALAEEGFHKLEAEGAEGAFLERGLPAESLVQGGGEAEAKAAAPDDLVDEGARRVDDDLGALVGAATAVPRLGRVGVVGGPDAQVDHGLVQLRDGELPFRVLVGPQVHVEQVGRVLRVDGNGHVADEVNLVDAPLHREVGLGDEVGADALNHLVDGLLQVRELAEGLGRLVAVLNVAGLGAGQHEPADVPLAVKDVVEHLAPAEGKGVGVAEDLLDAGRRGDDDGQLGRLGGLERVLLQGAELLCNVHVGLFGVHGLHDGDGIKGEPARDAPLDELVQHGAAERLGVPRHLVHAPGGEAGDGEVDGQKPVGPDERDGVGKHGTPDGVGRADARARVARRLNVLNHHAGIHLDHVRVRVQLLEAVGKLLVRRNVAKLAVALEAKELAKLVEGGAPPPARLDDALNLDDPEHLGDHVRAKGARGVLHGLLEDADQVLVPEAPVGLALQAVKGALARLRGDALVKLGQGLAELGQPDVFQVVDAAAREELEEEVVDPALVLFGDARVEAVEQVELDADHVAHAAGDALAIVVLANLGARIQGPVRVGVVEVHDGPEVVAQRNGGVHAADDEPRRVEQVVVLLRRRLGPLLGARVGRAVEREAAQLVDLEEHLGHVVVQAVVQHQHDVDAGRLAEETLLVKAVGLQLALLERADLKLFAERRPVEGCQVQVRGRVRLVGVAAVGPEDVVDDDGGVVKEHRRDAGLVLLEASLLAGHEEIKQLAGVGPHPVETLRAPDRLGVGRAGAAELGRDDVVVAAIGRPILMGVV